MQQQSEQFLLRHQADGKEDQHHQLPGKLDTTEVGSSSVAEARRLSIEYSSFVSGTHASRKLPFGEVRIEL